ncbi:MAG: hypothetical protein ACRDMH_05950 [Solirubrobacterales bacterium]
MGHDLIDEYLLWVHPVVLGRGRSFFEDGAERMDLELVDSTAIPSGGCHSHVPAAAVPIASACCADQPQASPRPGGDLHESRGDSRDRRP